MLRSFFTVGGWTLASRIMGFVRDILIAAYLGAGPVAEAFLVAFSLPNMFRRFFAEGAFNMAFIPLFSKKLESGDDPRGFAQDAFAGMFLILTVFTLVGIAFMPALVTAMASGFIGDARFDLAVTYGRIAFSYILFISLAALASGVLNANRRFLAAAAAPVLLNVVFITTLLAVGASGAETPDALSARVGLALAWAVPVGGIAQLALVWIAAARAGFPLTLRRPRLTPELKRLAIIAAPAALAGGVMQINLLVGRQVASFYDGAIAWLNYADRLYQLPLGVVGIAIGVVLLPELSRRLAASDTGGGQHAFSRATEMALTLTVPAAVAFMVVPLTLVSTLFERGAFDADDSASTALALAIYALGLPAFVLQKVLQPLYFAREDTRSPFRFALAALVINAALAVGLMPVFGFLAAALGTTGAGWAMVGLLARGGRNMGEAAQLDGRVRGRIWRIMAASAGMGLCLWLGQLALGPLFGMAGWKFLALALLVGIGMVSYYLIGTRIGAFALSDIRRAVRR